MGWRTHPDSDELTAPVGREVTVRITHCGMCHSDLHVQAGGFDMGGGKMSSLERAGTKLPVTMGHEIGGEVVEIGPDAQGREESATRSSSTPGSAAACARCASAATTICARARRATCGIQLPGGYADLVRVPHARYLVPIGSLEPARAATFACAGITAYGAINKLNPMTAEDHVAVIGCGGVGMTAVALLSGHDEGQGGRHRPRSGQARGGAEPRRGARLRPGRGRCTQGHRQGLQHERRRRGRLRRCRVAVRRWP